MNHVLLVSIAFSPNVGGIETHFDDLVKALAIRDWRVTVLTYKPISSRVPAKMHEFKHNNVIEIFRIPWFGGLFFRLVSNPVLEFIYLVPGLFLVLPFILLLKPSIKTIHSHGLVAGFVSVFWGRVFSKRVLTTTHSIYNFPNTGMYRNFAKWIFNSSDQVLTLSKQSKIEIENLGIAKGKITVFTYWVDLHNFRQIKNAKDKLRLKAKFIVLFVGRLIEEKGVKVLLDSAKQWNKDISLYIVGSGPLEDTVLTYSKKYLNIHFDGRVAQNKLPLYYSAANVLIVPSVHEEGFGRVIIESLACGTPVIGADRGAIPEALNRSVGILIKISEQDIKDSVESLYKSPNKLSILANNARGYAESYYSEKNADRIVNIYEE